MTSDRPRYSVSSLMAYEACPYQYYVAFVEGRAPPISPAMRRGTSVHSLIAQHFRQPSLLPPEAEPEIRDLLETFTQSRFNLPPVEVERPFVFPLEAGDVQGRVDVVLPAPKGGLEVVDFKSGSSRPREDLAESLQLPIYALSAAKRHDLSPEQVPYTYFFLGDNTEATFALDADTVLRVTERMEGIMRNIQAGRFEARAGCACAACRGEYGRPRPRRRR